MSAPDIYRRIFEEQTDGVAILEPETTRLEEVNRAYADLFGYDPSDLEGTSFVERTAERASLEGETLSTSLEAARRGESPRVECVLETGDGSGRHVELALESVDVDGERRLISTIRELRDRGEGRRSEETTQRLNVALSGTNTGVWEWDMESDEVIWTESMERLFGVEPGTFEGTFEAFAERVHPEDLPDVQAAIETAVAQDDIFQNEYRIRRDDGEQLWCYARGEIHEDGNGAKRIVGIVTDITKHKEQEQALRQQEQLYKQLADRLPEAYYTFDDDWTITYCNEVIADRLGTSVEDLRGTTVWETFPGVENTVLEETFREVQETREPASCEYHVEQLGYWVEAQAYPYEDGIAVISTDISDRKQQLTAVLDLTPVILFSIDTDGTIQESRGQALSKIDGERGALVGESMFDLCANRRDAVDAIERVLDGERVDPFPVEIANSIFQTQFVPMFQNGEVADIIGVLVDITEREHQREQMEFFNSILRHDVLNGMTVIKTRGELLAEQLEGDQARYARTIVDWCNTTAEVTQRVQRVIETLTTPDEDKQVEAIDVSAILRRKLTELRNAHPEVEFEGEFPPDVHVRADELLSDVLGNVLSNSIEHNDTDGLHVEATIECDDGVRIRIADDGTGIADGRKELVFRRGATSHAKETGSGFGLFFVDVMIEKYGGDVRVEDGDAGGACFVLEFPRADGGTKE